MVYMVSSARSCGTEQIRIQVEAESIRIASSTG